MMPTLYQPTGKPILYVWLDYESQSECPISAGSHRYAEHPSTRAYMASVIIVEPEGSDPRPVNFLWTDAPWQLEMPEGWEHVHGRDWLVDLLGDDRYEVWVIAHNASFERNISELTLKLPMPARWIDTMDVAHSRGLPAGLDKLGQYVYRTPKDVLGKNIMLRLCAPPKTGRNRGVLPEITRDDIQSLINYSLGDTIVCKDFSLDFGILVKPPHEQQVRDVHQAINHLGIGFDADYAEALGSMERFFADQARANVEEVTGGELKGDDLLRRDYLMAAINDHLPDDLKIGNMQARTLEDLMEDAADREDVEPEVLEVVKARLIVSRAALDKVRAAAECVGSDGRIRDQFVYWGAGPGRWSGRGTQPQNMKRPDEDFRLEEAIAAVKNRDSDAFLRLCVDEKGRTRMPYELLGSLVRGIFVPRPGYVYVVGDFASIEARVLMWLARQEEGLQEHRDADAGLIDDVYCSFASSIYGITVRKKTHKKERQAGKVGQLACLKKGTPVLTHLGWVPIEKIDHRHRVWDGHEWCSHDGVVERGVRPCMQLAGVSLTPDHLVLTGGWTPAMQTFLHPAKRERATALGMASLLASGSAHLPGMVDAPRCTDFTEEHVFDIANAGPLNRFQAGGLLVHNCGYGGGERAVDKMAFGGRIDLAAAGVTPKEIVQKWRSHYHKVPSYWGEVEQAWRSAAVQFRSVEAGRCRFISAGDRTVQVELPSGRKLTYMNARLTASRRKDADGRMVLAYDTMVRGAVRTKEIWGGTITENCFTGDTLVVTKAGPKPIREITCNDWLWDGTSFVQSRGAISKGVKEVGSWLGLRVTADHRILVGGTWKSVMHLDECASREALSTGRALALWSWFKWPPAMTGEAAAAATAVRSLMSVIAPCSEGAPSDAAPAGTMPPQAAAGNPMKASMCSMGTMSCGLPGLTAIPACCPDATTLPTGPSETTVAEASPFATSGDVIGSRSFTTSQPCPTSLPQDSILIEKTTTVGTSPETCASFPERRIAETAETTCGSLASASPSPCPKYANASPLDGEVLTPCTTTLQAGEPSNKLWKYTGEAEVFDVVECGPRHRFVVLTNEGPVVAHNCDQAISRDMLARVIRAAAYDRGYDVPLHVHDELVLEVRVEEAEEARAWLTDYMRKAPEWAPDVPLSSAPSIMSRYGKD